MAGGADTVGTWGLQPLAQAGMVSWAPVVYLQSTILWPGCVRLLPACPPSGDGRSFPYTFLPQEPEQCFAQSPESRSLALLSENSNGKERNSKHSEIQAPSQPCLQSTAEPTCLEQQQDGCVAAEGFGEDASHA
eukprot:Skav209909  [mRNA]  locus=scaffold1253:72957:75752:- [translate_table: standard]